MGCVLEEFIFKVRIDWGGKVFVEGDDVLKMSDWWEMGCFVDLIVGKEWRWLVI